MVVCGEFDGGGGGDGGVERGGRQAAGGSFRGGSGLGFFASVGLLASDSGNPMTGIGTARGQGLRLDFIVIAARKKRP